MASEKKIVYLDVATPELRASLELHLPPGFELSLAEAASQEQTIAAVADGDYILTWAAQMPTRVVEAIGQARLIQKIGEGTDRIDTVTAAARGITVAKTTGSNSVSVAEGASLLILATLRWLPNLHNAVVAGGFPKFAFRSTSYELRGKQVGIVGIGKIGRIVAEHMVGFGARVAYYDVTRLPAAEEGRLGTQFMSLGELLRTSDVVTLHVPLLPATRNLIDARALALMKPTAILVNTCRGPVVDEMALLEALRKKRIRGAGIDAFWKEPPDPASPLLQLDNVVLMPHCAAGTVDAQEEGIRHGYANIVRFDAGQPLDPADVAAAPKAQLSAR
jgi:phosphoglycerate dehydrogenase-like enzyme